MPRLSKFGAAALAAFGWTSGGASAVTASYLQVAGGGGGGEVVAGGGGAGGYLTGTTLLTTTLSYTVVVGAGGVGGVYSGGYNYGTNGNNSQFGTLTASVGGGAGGAGAVNGLTGGSGGGGGATSTPPAGSGGAGTSGQGNAGGAGFYSAGVAQAGGGGGGAGTVGGAGSSGGGGDGGTGLASSISGTSTYYAGGGGGGIRGSSLPPGAAGNGGGAAGNQGASAANSGTANRGGGGGGSGYDNLGTFYNGGNGGSGIVIISYAGAQQFGGGIVTSVGGNTIHTFLTSGTLSPLSSLSASYLIVAGGGGGGYEGGGGAGGMQTGSGLTIDTNSTYLVTVGSGGTGQADGGSPSSGANSSFSLVSTTSVGGGGGGIFPSLPGGNGGSGGGGASGTSSGNVGGTGTAGQGNNGGNGVLAGAGGGGGAGAVGGVGTSSVGGNGGNGTASSISGTSVTYAGGGGGAGTATQGTGGSGGGGNAIFSGTASSGTANTGGGGGGSWSNTGGNGGSGIVIISYAGSTQQMAGGSVTITGGNVIHTFTSSGYLTPLTYYSNSLRFRSSASAYLNQTPATTGSATTFTWSGWVKRGTMGSVTQHLWNGGTSVNTFLGYGQVNYDDLSGNLRGAGGTNYFFGTSALFRDPAAWYHIVLAVDTTQATSSNRMKLYVNGNLQTLSTANYPTQNLALLTASTRYMGQTGGGAYYFDGYMSNINFIDGQALTANSFGTFNSYGVWQPINYGGSYGTNGFYLPFSPSSSNYAAYFNGSSQYLNTSSSNLVMGTGDFTIEGWFNRVGGTNNGIFQLSPTAGGWQTNFNDTLSVQFGAASTLGMWAGNAGNGWTVDIQNNTWHHFALVRKSSVTTLYYNGSPIGSVADTVNYTGSYLGIGSYYSTGYTWNGYMSNFRIIKGTALYTSAFTPSTTPLTAVSGTELLTLQNATIIDNSANALTITNTGTTAMSVQSPFTANISYDQSPQGNNWATNGMSFTYGSTYDSMVDVPTLTSTTAANYAVLNPLQNPNGTIVTYNSANLGYSYSSGTANQMTVLSTIGITSGKFYWEFTEGSTVNSFLGVTTGLVYGGGANGTYYASTGGGITGSSAATYSGTALTTATGNIVGFAFDADALTLAVYKNNTLQGTFSSLESGKTWFPTIAPYTGSSGGNGAINFGQRPFAYTPPTGYVGLNTYNL